MTGALFRDSRGREYSPGEVLEALRQVGAGDCRILFVHTDLSFGLPAPGLGRKGYLDALWALLRQLGAGTLVFPAFTYSFCNGEDFDVRSSRTSMGALIEHVRKQPGVHRSLDPLLSMIAVGEEAGLMDLPLGNHSLGPGSGFDHLHRAGGVKFLFFGAEFAEYFTYVHYVEKMLEVPYRFDMPFHGRITDWEGNTWEATQMIHTACGKVRLKNFQAMKEELLKAGVLRAAPLGDSQVACISEEDAWREVAGRITRNINSFVEPFAPEDLTHEYTFGKNGERVTHC